MAFQGSLKELPLPDIIQLVSVSGKTGVFTLRTNGSSGEIFLNEGQIVHAKLGELEGEDAVYELAIWTDGDFLFTPGQASSAASIKKSNTNLLMEAARRIDEWKVLSKRIPSTALVPVFTSHALTTSVSLTPQEWGLISKIDERRTIEEVAVGLGMSPFEACKLLYGLITSGLITLRENLNQDFAGRLRSRTTEELRQTANAIHRHAEQLAEGSPLALTELAQTLKLSHTEIDHGREVDAVIDLIRNEEKILSAALGTEQSTSFLNHVTRLLGG